MTILGFFPSPEIRTGGHKRYAELSRQLADRGHTVVHVARPGMASTLTGHVVPAIRDQKASRIVPRWLSYGFAIRRRARSILEGVADAPDIVFAFGETNFYGALLLSRLFACPLVFALRSNFVDEYRQFGGVRIRFPVLRGVQARLLGWWKHRLEQWFCSAADRVVFQTAYDRDNVGERAPVVLAKADVIPNSFRVSWLRDVPVRISNATTAQRVLYLGNIGERKGVQYLIPAFHRAIESGSIGLHLDLIGFGGLEPWARAYVKEHGLDQHIAFLGRIDNPLELLANRDLLVIPSLYDSFPNTVLEALCVGTPVIGADAAGIRTILEDDRLLFPRADSVALSNRLMELATNQDVYEQVALACARRRSAFDFDWAERWQDVFIAAVAEAGRAGP